jgi:superfamily II DNA or RNA helicase
MNYFNSPEVFRRLFKLTADSDGRIESYVYNGKTLNQNQYHPKSYYFEHDNYDTIIVGSSNFTDNALHRNYEWNLRLSSLNNGRIVSDIRNELNRQIQAAEQLTEKWISKYDQDFREFNPIEERKLHERKIAPNFMQREALEELMKLRSRHQTKALLISATGTGKTILSALDVREFLEQYPKARVLFVAHRDAILCQAKLAYEAVFKHELDYGMFTGQQREFDKRCVFAGIDALRVAIKNAEKQVDEMCLFPSEDGDFLDELKCFDYIVIDETHRAGADSYKLLLGKIAPKFLLGMTATPERSDGNDIFKYFDHNIAYEIRLKKALDNDLLCPFHYYGIHDLDAISDGELSIDILVSAERVKYIKNNIERYKPSDTPIKALVYCSRNEESRRLAEQFDNAISLDGRSSIEERLDAIAKLSKGELKYLFTVDIFNEGIDIPEVNMLIMVRRTQSSIIFVQQLGRGLRKSPGKSDVIVLDFIGNYTNNYLIPVALFGKTPHDRAGVRRALSDTENPDNNGGFSSVYFDRIAKERIFKAIETAKLNSVAYIVASYKTIRFRLGRRPLLKDFYRLTQIELDPRGLLTKFDNLYVLYQKMHKEDQEEKLPKLPELSSDELGALTFMSQELLNGKRCQELELIAGLLRKNNVCDAVSGNIKSVLSYDFYGHQAGAFAKPFISFADDDSPSLSSWFLESLKSEFFSSLVSDCIDVGLSINRDEFESAHELVIGQTYTYKDACRLLNWSKDEHSTIYGYKTKHKTTPIFITLDKSDVVNAAMQYEDSILAIDHVRWYSRSERNTSSSEIRDLLDIKNNTPHLFVVRSNDASEGNAKQFYYLGKPDIQNPRNTLKPKMDGRMAPVVEFDLRLTPAILPDLYHYLTGK